MADVRIKCGDTVVVKIGEKKNVERPLIVTSVNKDGSVNGRLVHEPKDNPANDGNFQTFLENVKV